MINLGQSFDEFLRRSLTDRFKTPTRSVVGLERCPFDLSEETTKGLKYNGGRRFLGIYWERTGDELAYDDGVTDAAGFSDHWPFLAWKRREDVASWLNDNGVIIGSSDEKCRHRFILDFRTNALYVAPIKIAQEIVKRQSLSFE